MGNDTYSGGGSIILIGKDGLKWTSLDLAESKTTPRERRPDPSYKEREKQIRSFISQCAAAYAAENLTTKYPVPPNALKGIIKQAGGNIAWLAAERANQAFFHKAYCRLIGKEIPIEKIWARSTVNSTKGPK